MTVRDWRLANDYKGLKELCLFSEPVKVKILETKGNPPESYKLKLSNCKGIESVSGEKPKYRTEHILTISNFPSDYPEPGKLPTVRLETSMYHPNVYDGKRGLKPVGTFCFEGKNLKSINQPLDALVKRIIGMIQYENLQFGYPANGPARAWANKNKHLFPLSSEAISSPPKKKLNWL
ncbi:MAG: ubiquitin-conjugating enzyme E2 [Trichodesmium sp. MAG_R04]|nr:ubiquitin-conjugating enzyme E2 [Trichodesmium sp. MAG_R04]